MSFFVVLIKGSEQYSIQEQEMYKILDQEVFIPKACDKTKLFKALQEFFTNHPQLIQKKGEDKTRKTHNDKLVDQFMRIVTNAVDGTLWTDQDNAYRTLYDFFNNKMNHKSEENGSQEPHKNLSNNKRKEHKRFQEQPKNVSNNTFSKMKLYITIVFLCMLFGKILWPVKNHTH